MAEKPDQLFETMLKEAGVPTTGSRHESGVGRHQRGGRFADYE